MFQERKILINALISFLLIVSLLNAQGIAGAAIAVDADYVTIYPGEEDQVLVDVENNLDYDIEDVSVNLILDNVPFTAVGSSEKEIDEIDEDDSEDVKFTIRASTDATPGDYNIPYEITYENEDENLTIKQGSFGIRISAKTDLDFSVETKDAIVGKQGKISLKIINQGLGKIKFISIEIFPQGYELLSSKKVYIGTINSDDDDIASFDVLFKNQEPKLAARIDYKDFENKDQTETISIPLKVYTQEQALELGLIQKSNLNFYLGIAAIIIIIWVVWGRIKKSRKRKSERK